MRAVLKTSNRYCGPAAVSILTGVDTGTAAALMRQKYGRRAIRGSSIGEVSHALRELGCSMSPAQSHLMASTPKARPTLAQVLRALRADARLAQAKTCQGVLVVMTHHFGVASARQFCCSITGTPVSHAKAHGRRQRVVALYYVDKVAPAVALPIARRTDPERKAREEAKRLAAQWGVRIDKEEWGDWFVWHPGFDGDDHPADPYAGDHIVDSWTDALERVKGYAAACDLHGISVQRPLDSGASAG